jgi:hypothetical protein
MMDVTVALLLRCPISKNGLNWLKFLVGMEHGYDHRRGI